MTTVQNLLCSQMPEQCCKAFACIGEQLKQLASKVQKIVRECFSQVFSYTKSSPTTKTHQKKSTEERVRVPFRIRWKRHLMRQDLQYYRRQNWRPYL